MRMDLRRQACLVGALVMTLAGCPGDRPPTEVAALREQLRVPVDGLALQPQFAPRLRLALEVPDEGLPEGLAIEGGRQSVVSAKPYGIVLRVLVEPVDARTRIGDDPDHPDAAAPWLGSDTGIHPDDGRVQRLARASLGPGARVRHGVDALDRELRRELRRGWRSGPPDAVAALRAGRGECVDFALIGVSALRSAGVPSRVAVGLARRDDQLVYHAWVEYWDARWSTWDPTWGEHPAPATHVRLALWGTPSVAALGDVLGRLEVSLQPGDSP
ncbi:MAG: hypothetical protein EA398_03180 [Deltaproteobacteria bacterium]|nr:MAG: hypothetical protein EA398_03180 [Deltaproteobacteria bacterium]